MQSSRLSEVDIIIIPIITDEETKSKQSEITHSITHSKLLRVELGFEFTPFWFWYLPFNTASLELISMA
jgi:hypothetical protein